MTEYRTPLYLEFYNRIQEKQRIRLMNKYFFFLKTDIWNTTDDDEEDACMLKEMEVEQRRKRQKIDHDRQDKIIEWYRSNAKLN
tara:strand:+ start:248 stop:499 length:252 start_codon:yes stop_codon:yes gene_type:complete